MSHGNRSVFQHQQPAPPASQHQQQHQLGSSAVRKLLDETALREKLAKRGTGEMNTPWGGGGWWWFTSLCSVDACGDCVEHILELSSVLDDVDDDAASLGDSTAPRPP